MNLLSLVSPYLDKNCQIETKMLHYLKNFQLNKDLVYFIACARCTVTVNYYCVNGSDNIRKK